MDEPKETTKLTTYGCERSTNLEPDSCCLVVFQPQGYLALAQPELIYYPVVDPLGRGKSEVLTNLSV